jgi:hypothetical protein
MTPVSGTTANFQLVSQQQVDDTYSEFTYSAQLTVNGPAASSVIASASNSDPNSQLITNTLSFGDLSLKGSANSQNTCTIQRPTAQSFDPSTLAWNITSASPVATVTLLDSGTYDSGAGSTR